MKPGEVLPVRSLAVEAHEQILRRTRRIVEQSKRFAALNTIASAVSQSLDFQYTLNSSLQQVLHLVELEAGVIYLTDKSSEELILKAHEGLSQQLVSVIGWLRPDRSFIGPVVRTGEPLIGEIPWPDGGVLSKHLRRAGFGFFAAIPLKAKGSTLGVMLLVSRDLRRVDPDSDQFLASVGNVIGVAIENAALHRNIEALLAETRLQAERLRKSERQFRALIEGATDGMAIIQDGRFQYVNAYGLKMLGYSAEELRGLRFTDLVHPDYREAVTRNNARRLRGEVIPPQDITMVRKDGTELPVSLNGCLIEYEQGPAVLLIARNMTESKLLREQVLQAEKMAALGQLISSIAHELNNPLTTMIGYSDLLRMQEDLAESLREGLEAIHEAAVRASRIIKNLLTFARRHRSAKSLVDVNELLERTLALRAYEMSVNNIQMVKELAPHLPTTVADANQLQQVFLNLIINAEQAMLEAHGKGRLVVQTRLVTSRLSLAAREHGVARHQSLVASEEAVTSDHLTDERLATGDCIEITFADDGPGISATHLSRIFEPFFTTKRVGTGLGLSISRSIIQDHGGRIDVQSQPGSGATFIVELPVVKQLASTRTPPPERLPPPQAASKSVLIIDDEPAVVNLLQKIVEAEGHRGDPATSGAQALAKLEGRSYDLIFCDIKMPDLDGKELYRQIRQCNEALTRRIVFVTGDVVNEETRRFLEQTGSRYIEKPFMAADVIRVIRSQMA